MQTGHEKLGLDSRKNMPDVLAHFLCLNPQRPSDRGEGMAKH